MDIATQDEVLARIDQPRRLEFAEGIPAFRTLFSIPQGEIDASPGVVQNPGY